LLEDVNGLFGLLSIAKEVPNGRDPILGFGGDFKGVVIKVFNRVGVGPVVTLLGFQLHSDGGVWK
jgi:hypothetical protein